jgi:formylmethanofuran dehydrogenase subunit E
MGARRVIDAKALGEANMNMQSSFRPTPPSHPSSGHSRPPLPGLATGRGPGSLPFAMARRIRWIILLSALGLAALLGARAAGLGLTFTPPPAPPRPPDAQTLAVERVTAVHGGAGPFVVAGYRMGTAALALLDLPRGTFDLEVIHHSPRAVQYTCIADGAAAATLASPGRLNLSLAEAPEEALRTVYRRRSSGEQVVLRLRPEFLTRFLDTPRERLLDAGQEVLRLTDDEIFSVEVLGPELP